MSYHFETLQVHAGQEKPDPAQPAVEPEYGCLLIPRYTYWVVELL